MNILGLLIAGSLLVIVIILTICYIYDTNKEKKKYKKDVEELKVGNRYKMKKFSLWIDDNPFIVEPTYIVEIIDIKVNNKNKLFVQYKQIEPEYKGKPFSESFSYFRDSFDLIRE